LTRGIEQWYPWLPVLLGERMSSEDLEVGKRYRVRYQEGRNLMEFVGKFLGKDYFKRPVFDLPGGTTAIDNPHTAVAQEVTNRIEDKEPRRVRR